MPLAIELATARVRGLAPRVLAARLDQRLRLLRTTGRATGTHHDTLEATIAWSYDLLTESERRLFERLAVFPASFDAAAVAAVAGDLVPDELEALDWLDRLAGKSLIVPDGSARFRLFASIQTFAAGRLAKRGDIDEAAQRHAAHYQALALRLGPLLYEEPGTEALDRLDIEHPNLVQAVDWWSQHDPRLALDLMFAVHHAWLSRAHGAEDEQRFFDLLNRLPQLDAASTAKALWSAGAGRFFHGDTRGTRPIWQEALAGMPHHDPDFAQLAVLIAQLALFDGDLDDAHAHLALAWQTIPRSGPPTIGSLPTPRSRLWRPGSAISTKRLERSMRRRPTATAYPRCAPRPISHSCLPRCACSILPDRSSCSRRPSISAPPSAIRGPKRPSRCTTDSRCSPHDAAGKAASR